VQFYGPTFGSIQSRTVTTPLLHKWSLIFMDICLQSQMLMIYLLQATTLQIPITTLEVKF